MNRDLVAGEQAAFHPHPLARGWLAPQQHLACDGQKVVGGVFGVEAHFNGVPIQPHIFLLDGQPLPLGEANLPRHQIQPRHHLGHGMLNLDAGVHLQKVKLAIFAQ